MISWQIALLLYLAVDCLLVPWWCYNAYASNEWKWYELYLAVLFFILAFGIVNLITLIIDFVKWIKKLNKKRPDVK